MGLLDKVSKAIANVGSSNTLVVVPSSTVCYANSTVSGVVHLSLAKEVDLKSIEIRIKGTAICEYLVKVPPLDRQGTSGIEGRHRKNSDLYLNNIPDPSHFSHGQHYGAIARPENLGPNISGPIFYPSADRSVVDGAGRGGQASAIQWSETAHIPTDFSSSTTLAHRRHADTRMSPDISLELRHQKETVIDLCVPVYIPDPSQVSLGQHQWSWSLQLPNALPHSCVYSTPRNEKLFVRYEVQAKAICMGVNLHATNVPITVIPLPPLMNSPGGGAESTAIHWCCLPRGSISLKLWCDRSVVYPGDVISCRATIENESSSRITDLYATLHRAVNIHRPHMAYHVPISRISLQGVARNSHQNLDFNIVVPTDALGDLSCNLFTCRNTLRLKAIPKARFATHAVNAEVDVDITLLPKDSLTFSHMLSPPQPLPPPQPPTVVNIITYPPPPSVTDPSTQYNQPYPLPSAPPPTAPPPTSPDYVAEMVAGPSNTGPHNQPYEKQY